MFIKLANEIINFIEKNGESISKANSKWYQMLGWKRVTTRYKKEFSLEQSEIYKKVLKVSPNSFMILIPEKYIKGLSDEYDSKFSVLIFDDGNRYLHKIVNY